MHICEASKASEYDTCDSSVLQFYFANRYVGVTIGPNHKYQSEPYDRAREARKVNTWLNTCSTNEVLIMHVIMLVS